MGVGDTEPYQTHQQQGIPINAMNAREKQVQNVSTDVTKTMKIIEMSHIVIRDAGNDYVKCIF